MLELERLGGRKKPVGLGQVSKITGISKRYLEQLAIALKSHSLVRGVSGRNGGYVLARPASTITIGDVLSAVTGPINLTICVVEPDLCMRSELCECRPIWTLLNLRINKVLEEFSIADLLDRELLKEVRARILEEGDPGARAREEADSEEEADPEQEADPGQEADLEQEADLVEEADAI